MSMGAVLEAEGLDELVAMAVVWWWRGGGGEVAVTG